MTTPDNHESKEDEFAAYNYGIHTFQLISLLAKNQQQQYEFKAYIEHCGIVLITNQGTINGEPKIKEGNNIKMLPDTVIYLTLEQFTELVPGKDNAYVRLRKPYHSSHPPVADAQNRTKGDIRRILEKK